ncbi:hypothetical protein ACVDFE_18185 [Lentzea chajnantorensis]
MLSQQHQRFFGLLALHPGDEVTVEGAAALAEVDLMTAKRMLRDLRNASLVDQQNRFHDLIRDYALHSIEADPVDLRTEAEDRLVRHFGERALAALADAGPGNVEWLEAHVGALIATAAMARRSGRQAESLVLAWALADFARIRSESLVSPDSTTTGWEAAVQRARERIEDAKIADHAADFTGNEHAFVSFLINFSKKEFFEKCEKIRDLATADRNSKIASSASLMLAFTWSTLGCPDKAVHHLQDALQHQDSVESNRMLIAGTHHSLASTLHRLNRSNEAVYHAQKALVIFEDLKDTKKQDRLRSMIHEMEETGCR